MNTQLYFKNIEKEVRAIYDVAEEARKKGLDPVNEVEIPLAMNMAEKVVGLISTIYPQMQGSGIAKRILELEKEYGKLDSTVVFKIAEEVAKQKFCQFSSLLQAIDVKNLVNEFQKASVNLQKEVPIPTPTPKSTKK